MTIIVQCFVGYRPSEIEAQTFSRQNEMNHRDQQSLHIFVISCVKYMNLVLKHENILIFL